MKTKIKTLLTIGAVAGLSFTTAQAATLATTGNVQLDSSNNWSPSQLPASGMDSLNLGHNLTIDSTWTIGTGQSMTWTAGNTRLANGGNLTLATGGTLSADGFYESGATAASGRSVTFEAGATASTRRYLTGGGTSAGDSGWTTKWIANSAGVTTFNISADWGIRGSAIEVDLTNYDASNGSTLILADYGSLSSDAFNSVNVIGDFTYTFERAYDQGGGDFAVALTNIVSAVPEPSSTALLGLGLSSLLLRRKRSS